MNLVVQPFLDLPLKHLKQFWGDYIHEVYECIIRARSERGSRRLPRERSSETSKNGPAYLGHFFWFWYAKENSLWIYLRVEINGAGIFGTFISDFGTLKKNLGQIFIWLPCSASRSNSKILNCQIIILDTLLVLYFRLAEYFFIFSLNQLLYTSCADALFHYSSFKTLIYFPLSQTTYMS